MLLEQLKAWDVALFLYLNGKHNAFFDVLMYGVSNKFFWIPLYLFIAVLIVWLYRKRSWIVFVGVAVLITVADQLSSHLIKPWAARLRPSHNPDLAGLVHLSKAGAGGWYGFVSGHAANSFALFVFLSLVLGRRFPWLPYVLFLWAVLIGYSRIYVGVHYPGDVLCGAVLGALCGQFVFFLLTRVTRFRVKA